MASGQITATSIARPRPYRQSSKETQLGTASSSYDHGTVLHKRDFVDSCYMRYGWTLLDLPISCACGNAFNVQHALDCKLGGLRIIQHNEVRDTIAQFMREAGLKAVELEPQLQPLDGEAFDYKSAMMKRAVILNAAGSGVICDRRILMLRWFHLLPEAMHTWTLHSSTRMPNARRFENTRNVF